MVDEDIAYLSPSTVYRILREEKLVCPWRRRAKRRREEEEKAQRPNAIWATDLKYVSVGARNYYLICFLDEYSRYIVHHELLPRMDGHTVSLAAQAALEKLPSALSQDNFGIHRLQFAAGVGEGHLPVDAALLVVPIR